MRLIDADVLKKHIDKLPALPDGNFAGNHSALKALINMQPTIEPSTSCSEIPNTSDTISRQAALDALDKIFDSIPMEQTTEILTLRRALRELPSAQPSGKDPIEREAVVDILHNAMQGCSESEENLIGEIVSKVDLLPSAQPERTCVNCGRTVNNGGWYADGKTRCPIEEHYALPKDGYCHLWEKRNVTDDDYPEGRADE